MQVVATTTWPAHVTRLCAALALASPAAAQATPATQPASTAAIERVIFTAFPEADAYRLIVGKVDQDARRTIEQRLPFKVHFNELGDHRLFVAFRGRRPTGLVYLRTEEADWGLAEIAWSLTLDLRVLGFEYVRGRGTQLKTLQESPFARTLTGRDFAGVVALLSAEDGPHGVVDHDATALRTLTMRSAAKALAVTGVVWNDEIEKLRDQAIGFDLFPAAARFTRRNATFELEVAGAQQSVTAKVLYAFDLADQPLGTVVWTTSAGAREPIHLRWTLDRNDSILVVTSTDAEPSLPLRTACSELAGQRLRAADCERNLLGPLARGLGAAIDDLQRRGRR